MLACVTGATGFIGGHLCRFLREKNIHVRALVRRPERAPPLADLGVELIEGDLLDEMAVEKAAEGADFIFHIAGVITAHSREGFFRPNVLGTRLLALAALRNPKLKRLIYTSSLAAAGPSREAQPRTEDLPNAPVSLYGLSKLAGELELNRLAPELPFTIARPPVVYGPGDRGLLIFFQSINRGFCPALPHGRGYSSIHVSDLCQGLWDLAQSPATLGKTYFLTGDEILSFQEMMSAMTKAVGRKSRMIPLPRSLLRALMPIARVLPLPSGLAADKLNELYERYWICSNQRAREDAGFQPRVRFESGAQDTVKWYREYQWLA